MIDYTNKAKLYGELDALIDETAEQSRKKNISTKQLELLIEAIYRNHNDCLRVLTDYPDADVDELIQGFRGIVRALLHNPQLLNQ